MLLAIGLTMVASHRKNPSEVLSEISASIEKLILKVKTTSDIAWLRSPGSIGLPKPLSEETKVFETNIKIQTPQRPDTAIGPTQTDVPATSAAVSSNGLMTGENQLALLAAEQKTGRKAKVVKKEDRTGGWTVQAVATTDKGIASHWSERLKAKGYEAFVVRADIRGQTWYRVRAGRFNTPKEAETLRAGLKSTEGFQDAFVAANKGSEIVVASYPNEDFPVNR
jgi:cell division septation protein DedD